MFKGADSRGGTHQSTLRINLLHDQKRKDKSEELAVGYRSVIRDFLKTTAGAKFQIIEDPPGPPVQSTFLVKIKGPDADLLSAVALDLEKKNQSARYHLACAYALLDQAESAMRHLRLCLKNDADHRYLQKVVQNEDFDSLRRTPGFNQLIAQRQRLAERE